MDSISQDGGGVAVGGGVSSTLPTVAPRVTVAPWNDWTAFEFAPCQSVVLSNEDGIDARCKYGLAGHPKKVGEPNVPMHESEDSTCRWWLDGEGDIHLAFRPGVHA